MVLGGIKGLFSHFLNFWGPLNWKSSKSSKPSPENSEGIKFTDYVCFSSNLRYEALPWGGVPVPLFP